MSKNIYIVTSGEYSDYEIEKVFSKEEDAKIYASVHGGCRVEEYPLDDVVIKARNYTKYYCCTATIKKLPLDSVLSLSDIKYSEKFFFNEDSPKSNITKATPLAKYYDVFGRLIVAYGQAYSKYSKEQAYIRLIQEFQSYTQSLLERGEYE